MINHVKDVADDKTVQLIVMRLTNKFVVKSITNTTYYIPGDEMTRETVQQCCMTPRWQVTLIDNDIIKTIFGGITGGLGKLVP